MKLVTDNAHGMDCEECGEKKPRLVAIGCYAHDVSVGGRLICASCLQKALVLTRCCLHCKHRSTENWGPGVCTTQGDIGDEKLTFTTGQNLSEAECFYTPSRFEAKESI